MRSTVEEIHAVLLHMEQMHSQGLPDETYYKCLVTLASELLCRHGDQDYALIVLNKCPPSYYGMEISTQMREDLLFAQAVVELVHKLVQYGIVEAELYTPTMRPANA